LASPGQSTALLKETLARSGYEPSKGLTAIFDALRELVAERAPLRRLVTTTLVLLAVEHLSRSNAIDDRSISAGERRAVKAYGAILRRDPALFERRTSEYFGDEDGGPSHKSAAISSNVGRVIEDVIGRLKTRSDDRSPVTATNFLLSFPGPKGNVHNFLGGLSIDPAQLHQAVDDAARDPNDRVSTHRDEPAESDELGRLAFAGVLADRIREAHDPGRDSAFIVHIHGPWGSGKSSVLNFLEENLEGTNWIVVKFNAWRDQRRQPPWWSLIMAIYSGARADLKDDVERERLICRWRFWRLRADFLPIVAVLACLALTAILIYLGIAASANAALAVLAGTVPLAGAIYFGSRSLALGSRRAAQAYAELKSDPYEPITRLFETLIGATSQPLAVFIDDLDRCDGKYVVELLEGIQTLMRGKPVTYVIAADRKWICSSFEQRYEGFTEMIGEPGRPLGYLFLDKIFQISAPIPQLPLDKQTAYWKTLLKRKNEGRAATAKALADATVEASAEVANLTTHEQLEDYLAAKEVSAGEVGIQAARAAAASRITSPEAAVETEHRLRDFASLIEPNPRSMKRLVNAYGMHQATLFLSGRVTEPGPLARWTIVELRWPLLADFLATRPKWADKIRADLSEEDRQEVPDGLQDLFGDEFVVDVVGEAGPEGLTSAAIKSILGTGHHER